MGPGVGVRAQEEARVLWDISFVNLWEITLLGPQRQALGCPCKVACKKHQQLPPPVSLSPLVPLGRVRLDHIQVLTQIPFFLGAPQDLPEPGGCCPPPCPNPELIWQCLLLTETLLGKLRRHEVLSLL